VLQIHHFLLHDAIGDVGAAKLAGACSGLTQKTYTGKIPRRLQTPHGIRAHPACISTIALERHHLLVVHSKCT